MMNKVILSFNEFLGVLKPLKTMWLWRGLS